MIKQNELKVGDYFYTADLDHVKKIKCEKIENSKSENGVFFIGTNGGNSWIINTACYFSAAEAREHLEKYRQRRLQEAMQTLTRVANMVEELEQELKKPIEVVDVC